MKRLIYIIIFMVLVFLLTVALFIKPIIIFFSKQQLRNVFLGSTVMINGCDFKPLHLLTLLDIDIRKDDTYDFKVKEVRIEYSLFSIIKKSILKLSLKDTRVTINLRQKNILELTKQLNLKSKSRFLIDFLELSDLNLNLNSADLGLEATLSLGLNLTNRLIKDLYFKIVSLENPSIYLNNASLVACQKSYPGIFYIDRIKYNKLLIENIKSDVKLEDKFLSLDSLSAEILGGKMRGTLSLQLEENAEYLVNLKFKDIDLNTLFNDFDLNEKAQISGKINGTLTLEARGPNINVISGYFTTAEGGGVLTIKDNDYLKKIATNSNQSLDILMESFKNYHYNIGTIKLSLEQANLILDIAFDGEAGKRNLNITLHDFKLRR